MKQTIETLINAVEQNLTEIQQLYFKHERYCPERLQSLGLDNIIGNASLYDFCYLAEKGEKQKAKESLNDVKEYIASVLKVVEAYKPLAICTWRGLDSDIWVPLREVAEALTQKLNSSNS